MLTFFPFEDFGKTQKSIMYLKLACQLAIYLELNKDPSYLEHFKYESWVIKDVRRRIWHVIINSDMGNFLTVN